jgi:hypothetical protein
MVEDGRAPARRYEIMPRAARADGRVEIVWLPDEPVATAAIEAEIQAANQRVAKKSRRRAAAPKAKTPEPAPGTMPEKPVITSATNAVYQKRFDRLAALAAAGDWAGVAVYEVKGSNTYSKILRRYRDQLLAAHAAQQG